ncbi:peptidoglycan recognition protein family protein [Pimelobacter simplex]|nr:peptidoglycan recognition family protein [Pimelobacter simplex]
MSKPKTPKKPTTTPRRFSRKDWRARDRRRHPGTLDRHQVEGIALHWPGMPHPLGTVTAVMNALRSWQRMHMDDNGWSDIAYQVAIDQQGNRYRLRGLKNRSAANGDTSLNLRYGAVLLVLAEGEKPSPAMIAEVRRVVARHRALFPRSRKIVPHSAIRPGGTDCPGDAVRKLIDGGVFAPVVLR